MKNILYLIIVVLLISCAGDTVKDPTGSIYGVITDKATGEPIRSAGVQLNPIGIKTVTGNEGQYEFVELNAGEYSIEVTKTGYVNLENYIINVGGGKTNKGDVQIEKLPPSLRITNNDKQDISELNFGDADADITRSFNIFNDGPEPLEWEISTNCEWITKVSKEEGTLKAGATQAIVITINRELLSGGENTTTIHVTSNNGSKQLTIKGIGQNRTLPTLNMLEVVDITSNSASFHGEITGTGLPSYTERGFIYSTSTPPTIENAIEKVTVVVNPTTKYSASVKNLKIDQKYYVRAFAVNGMGIAYSSNDISFTVIAEMPTLSTQEVSNKNIGAGAAIFNGTIETIGDPAYTERGFVYGINRNPIINDVKETVSGIGVGSFSKQVVGIAEGKIYYVRAYATNSKGTVYGEEVSFDFNAEMPTLSTQEVSNKNIGAGTAVFNGFITTIGDPAYTERGFVYGVNHNPTINDIKKVVSGMGVGSFSTQITGIAEGKIYYVRAYATSSKGTVYGEEVSFNFCAEAPILKTLEVTNINATSNINAVTVTLNGNIVNSGDPIYSEKGFVYSTMQNPTVNDMKITVSGNNVGLFSINLKGLTVQTTYYVKAYAVHNQEIIYGEQISFSAESPYYVVFFDAGIMIQKQDISSSAIDWTTANSLCENSIMAGYNDWRLPTISELLMMYSLKDIIGNLKTEVSYGTSAIPVKPLYWSNEYYGDQGDSDIPGDCYKGITFNDGLIGNGISTKNSNYHGGWTITHWTIHYARAIRTIH